MADSTQTFVVQIMRRYHVHLLKEAVGVAKTRHLSHWALSADGLAARSMDCVAQIFLEKQILQLRPSRKSS